MGEITMPDRGNEHGPGADSYRSVRDGDPTQPVVIRAATSVQFAALPAAPVEVQGFRA